MPYLEQLTDLMNDMHVDIERTNHVERGYLSVLESLTILVDRNPILFDLVIKQLHELAVKIIAESN